MNEVYTIYYQPKNGLTNGSYDAFRCGEQAYTEDIARRCREIDPSNIWEVRKEIKQ